MPKQPLTPTGVSDKLDEIYAMTTHNRLAEAAAIESNFKSWVGDNFNLTTAQSNFLSGISASAAAHYGANCGLCFRNSLGIALIVPTPADHARKWLKMTNNLLINTNDTGDLEVTGSLTFSYEYRV